MSGRSTLEAKEEGEILIQEALRQDSLLQFHKQWEFQVRFLNRHLEPDSNSNSSLPGSKCSSFNSRLQP